MKVILQELDELNREMSRLKYRKEDLEKLILEELNEHPEEGQRTYEFGQYKLVVKTGINYKIDKEKYDSLEIPQEINPVKTSIKYEVDGRKMRELKDAYGVFFSEFITETPSKPNLTVGAR